MKLHRKLFVSVVSFLRLWSLTDNSKRMARTDQSPVFPLLPNSKSAFTICRHLLLQQHCSHFPSLIQGLSLFGIKLLGQKTKALSTLVHLVPMSSNDLSTDASATSNSETTEACFSQGIWGWIVKQSNEGPLGWLHVWRIQEGWQSSMEFVASHGISFWGWHNKSGVCGSSWHLTFRESMGSLQKTRSPWEGGWGVCELLLELPLISSGNNPCQWLSGMWCSSNMQHKGEWPWSAGTAHGYFGSHTYMNIPAIPLLALKKKK